MIYGLLILLLLFCILDFWKNKKIFSPVFIFNAIWFITLFLYQFKLSYIQQDLSNRTLLIFFVCVISYNLVFIILNMLNSKYKMFSKKDKEKRSFFGKTKVVIDKVLTEQTLDKKVKFAKYLVIVIFIVEVIYSGGVPLVWKFMGSEKLYIDFGIPSLHGAFNGLVICLGAYSLFKKSKDKFLYLGIGVLIISRQIVLSMIIEAIIFEIVRNNNFKRYWKKIAIIAIITVIGFTVIGNFRSGNNVMEKVFQAKEEYRMLPDTIKWIYSYMTFSVSNFNKLVGMTDGCVNYGVSMLREILPTVILDEINIKPNQSFFYLISLNYNVATYLPNIYLDFGIIGIGVVNALIALLGFYLYKKVQEENSIKNALLYAVFLHNIVFLFFINMFLFLPIIVQFLYIPLLFSEKEKCDDE